MAGAARYAIGKKYAAVATRLEYFNDMNGFTTGTAQTVKEFTLTGEYKLTGLADDARRIPHRLVG